MKQFLVLISIVVSTLVVNTSAAEAIQRSELAATIQSAADQTIERLGAPPGMALAVVRGNKVLYVGGAGSRDLEQGLAVDENTDFYIASSTKSFTALAAALLAERGVIDLDKPFTDYLPEVKLPTEEPVTIRQLLTHTSGLENMPVVLRTAYTGEHTPDVLMKLLSQSRVKSREFDYTNLGYVITSLVLDRVTGESWKDLLATEIFEPLGMSRTTAYVSKAKDWQVTRCYDGWIDGQVEMPFIKTDETMHAAGGLLSTAADLSRWLLVQINEGRLDGKQVFPSAVIRETHLQQATTDQKFGFFHRKGYGLGWYVSDYEGELMLHHFGGFAGFRSHVSFMPEHEIGVAALINSSSAGFLAPDIVAAYVYDLLLGRDDALDRLDSRLAEYHTDLEKSAARSREHRAEREKRVFKLSLEPRAYTGTFFSDALGTARIEKGDEGLSIRIGVLEAPFEPYVDDESVRVELVPGSGDVIQFVVDDGRVTGFENNGVFFERVKSEAPAGGR